MKLPKKEAKVRKRNMLVWGVGINDADYCISRKERMGDVWKIVWRCPLYSAWAGMLERCFSQKFKQKHGSYEDCICYDEWLIFSKFREWAMTQDWEGKSLDKDILITGNKLYSPETCIFVPHKVNTFVLDRSASRGEYMIGVTKRKDGNKYQACCGNPFSHRNVKLGSFQTELEAHLAWKAKKHEFACQLADSEYCNDPRLANALRTRYDENSDWTNK